MVSIKKSHARGASSPYINQKSTKRSLGNIRNAFVRIFSRLRFVLFGFPKTRHRNFQRVQNVAWRIFATRLRENSPGYVLYSLGSPKLATEISKEYKT